MYSALVIVPEVVVTVSEGLCFTLQGYKVGGERVYRAELKQGRVPCACLYTEQEYKDLVVEAHYTCRYHYYENPGQEKRYFYWCNYCHEDFSDKNALSYHRYKDQCDKWREVGSGVLKMYPTFTQSEQHVLKGILQERGLKFPEEEGHRPWNPRVQVPRVVQPKSKKTRESLKETSRGTSKDVVLPNEKVPKEGLCTTQQPHVTKLYQKKECAQKEMVERERTTVMHDRFTKDSHTVVQTLGEYSDTVDTVFRVKYSKRDREGSLVAPAHSRGHPKGPVKKKSNSLAGTRKRKKDVVAEEEVLSRMQDNPNTTNLPSADHEDTSRFHTSPRVGSQMGAVHSNVVHEDAPISSYTFSVDCTREEVLEKAQRYAASLTVENTYPNIGRPPQVQSSPGLYHLIQDSPASTIIDRRLLHNHEECMAELRILESRDELGERIHASIGPWVQWKESQVRACRTPLAVVLFSFIHNMLV